MRPKLIVALREYYPDVDDATDDPRLIGPEEGIPAEDPARFRRLLLRALREQQQDINALQQANTALAARVAALEAKVG